MNIRLLSLALATSLAGSLSASAQRAPMCASRYDKSDFVEHMFDTFVNDDAIEIRKALGIVTQSPSAPRGLLRDNAACARLRVATRALFASRKDSIPRDTDFSFFRLGDYVGVFVNFEHVPGTPVVSGTKPLYVFKVEKRPTEHEASGEEEHAERTRKYTFVGELQF
jgi:hypothetical protein